MKPNATLLVQAINFFVAYLMLRYLFIKPAVKAIEQEQQEKDHLQANIDEREKKLQKTAEKKEQEWSEFQEQFSHASPPVKKARIAHADVKPIKKEQELTEQQQDQIAEDVKEAIVKKVRHVSK